VPARGTNHTVEDVARAALGALDTDASLLRAAKWAAERYRELTNRSRFRHLMRTGEIALEPPVTAGTVTVTPGSVSIVADATAQAAIAVVGNIVGQFIRCQVAWYEIINYVAATGTIELKSPYSETASGAGTGFRIVQRFVTLDPSVRFLGEFVHTRRHRKLRKTNKMALDLHYPGRNLISGGPRAVADLGVDPTTHERRVEFYPYNDQRELIVYQYWVIAPDISERLDTPLPNEVDLALLKQGVLVDLYRYEMAKLMHAGKVEAAALMRNEARAQATTWESAIEDIIRADRASEDVSFVLKLHGGGAEYLDDPLIQDAHDEVLARWPL
jgi:hypothetical protein